MVATSKTETKPAAKKTTSKASTAEKKPAVTKKAAAPATKATKKTATKAPKKASKISSEQFYKMVEVAAYYIAEKNGFSGSPSDYWVEAEAQIKSMMP